MKRINHLIISTLLIISLSPILSQAQLLFDTVKFIEQHKRAVLSIETVPNNINPDSLTTELLGSGVLVKKSNKFYAITNYHVIKQKRTDQNLVIGYNHTKGKRYNFPSISNFDAVNDIAVLAFGKEFLSKNKPESDQAIIDQAAVGVTLFADSSLVEGIPVMMIGFPLGIGINTIKNMPISRTGMVCQSLPHSPAFLVDGIISHGNSGGPIFSLPDGWFLGIVRGFLPEHITGYDENGNMIVSLPYNSGMSLCVSAATILKLIP